METILLIGAVALLLWLLIYGGPRAAPWSVLPPASRPYERRQEREMYFSDWEDE